MSFKRSIVVPQFCCAVAALSGCSLGSLLFSFSDEEATTDAQVQSLGSTTVAGEQTAVNALRPADYLECTPFDKNRGDGMAEVECRFLDSEGRPTARGALVKKVWAVMLSGRNEQVEFEVSSVANGGPFVLIRFPIESLDLAGKFVFAFQTDAEAKANTASASARLDPFDYIMPDSARSLARSNDAFSLGIDLAACSSPGFQSMKSVVPSVSTQCDAGRIVILVSEDTGNGRSPAMACCPLETPEILRAERPEERSYACNADEVMVGFSNLIGNRLLCARLDPKKASLGGEHPAIFLPGEPSAVETIKFIDSSDGAGAPLVMSASDLVNSMRSLAQNFGGRDTLACSPNSLMVSRKKRSLEAGELALTVFVPVCRSIAPVKK